jgi:hypothetical protein
MYARTDSPNLAGAMCQDDMTWFTCLNHSPVLRRRQPADRMDRIEHREPPEGFHHFLESHLGPDESVVIPLSILTRLGARYI